MLQSLGSKIHRRVSQRLSRYAGLAVSHPAVRQFRERRYVRQLAVHEAALPTLTGNLPALVDDLRRRGVSQTHVENLGIAGAARIIALAQRLVAEERADFRAQADMGRKFLMMRAAPIIANPELYLFGLNRVFLDLAETYLGLPVGYDGVSIQYTPADGEEIVTRIWHRDREDRKMLKVILYLNDVDGDGGPFQLLPRAFEPAAQHQHYFLTPEERHALDTGALGEVVTCEGPSGTAIFADTAGFFHRGKPAHGNARGAVFFSYFAQRPEYPFFCDRSGVPRQEVARLVGDLPLRQRRAALWWDSLSLPLRFIPSAPVV